MSLFGRQRRYFGISGPQDLVPQRGMGAGTGSVYVTADSAMRNSAVWACLRLRAGLVSTSPVSVFREVGGIQVEMPTPPVLVRPGGDAGNPISIVEWLYSTQVDLDRAGNCFGLIVERNGAGLPSRIDLQQLAACSIIQRRGEPVRYRIDGMEYGPEQVWHERQYTVAGLPMGLSPVAYAAWTVGQYESAQKFAVDWYAGGGVPKSLFKNTDKTINPVEADKVKLRYKAAIEGRDVLVVGKDWEYSPIQAEAVGADWLEAQKFGVGDIARFFDVPGDLIDAPATGKPMTYANIGQRNLQLLIMHLQPAVYRRELALSGLLPAPRVVKLDTDALLLRMDPQTRAGVQQQQIASRTLAPSEVRAAENRPPLTETQMAEFDRLFGAPTKSTSVAETIQKAYLGVGKMITSDEARQVANAVGAELPIPGPDFPPAAAPASFGGATP